MSDSYREPIDDAKIETVPLAPAGKSVEDEIFDLEKKLAEKRAMLGQEKQKPLEQVIGQEKAKPQTTTQPATSSAPVSPSQEPAKEKAKELKRYEKTQQLKGLIDIAFQKGVSYAVQVAREMDNPFLLDELHDVMVDELKKELIDRGKLEEI